jgi:hypothetical protein
MAYHFEQFIASASDFFRPEASVEVILAIFALLASLSTQEW